MVGGSIFVSSLILAISFSVLAYAILAFAHVRITDADMSELERLRLEGVLPTEPRLVEDFRVIHAKLAEIAPAVYLRQEFWLQIYFYLIRFARWVRHDAAGAAMLDRELLRLSAYQAHHYRVALTRLQALRNPSV
ncbi:MAG: hypothetical protein ACRD1L_01435 [Terriglobales bacterium]